MNKITHSTYLCALALMAAGCAGTPDGASCACAEDQTPMREVEVVQHPTEDDEIYAPTAVGECEVKRLPAGRILESSTAGNPRERTTMNRVFMPLFNYIREQDIAMTVPVEMRGGESAAMAFHLGGEAAVREDLPERPRVAVRELPERLVASLGARGGYTEARFADTENRLRSWLAEHPGWVPIGEAYGVFWNSPWVPDFLKRSEVHIPVRRVKAFR